MYSFYGGRPGNSFVIVRYFPSVTEMANAFKQGPSYTEVHYNEHVLINTPNRNDEDNGKIFRRGYNYQNDMGGAEYIGTIVGPAGPAPNLKIGDFSYLQGEKNNIDSSLISDETEIEQWGNGSGLVPGKDGNNYNDTIKWKSFIVKENGNSETTAYIGFEIPYPVIEFQASSGTAYEQPVITPVNADDNQDHPFYKKWNIKVPKGIRGDNLADLKIKYKYQNDETNPPTIYYDDLDENSEDTNLGPWICYKLKTFTESSSGQNIDEWNPVCPYTVVSEVYQSNDGRIHVKYTDGTDVVNENTDTMKWVDSLSVDEFGVITVHFTDNTSNPLGGDNIQWLKDMRVNSAGGLQVRWNNGEDFVPLRRQSGEQVVLEVVTNLELNNFGKLIATYNILTGYHDSYYNVDMRDIGEIETHLNEIAESSSGFPNGLTRQAFQQLYITQVYKTKILNENSTLKWIENLSQQGNQITITYNAQDENPENESDFLTQTLILNYPVEFKLEEDGKLNVKWQDSTNSGNGQIENIGTIDSIIDAVVDANGNLLFRFSATQGNYSYGGYDDWVFIGTVSAQAFGFQANSTTITNKLVSGFIKNNKLYFNLQTSLLLPTSIANITINDNSQVTKEISFSSKDGTIQDSFDPAGYAYTLHSGLCGLDFECYGLDSLDEIDEENLIPVDVYIESLGLNFTFTPSDQEAMGGDLISRLEKIQSSLYEKEPNQEQIDKLAQAIGTINSVQTQLAELQQRINSAIQTIQQASNAALTANNYISGNVSNMSIATYGGTNILNALQYLRKPSNGLLIPIGTDGQDVTAMDGTGTAGRYGGRALNTGSDTGTWDETKDTQQLFFLGSKRITNQQHGYLLQWSRSNPTQADYSKGLGANFIFYFIPREFVTNQWKGLEISLFGHFNRIGLKYIYIMDDGTQTRIHGHYRNWTDGLSYNNMTIDNQHWVLSGVYGV